MKWRVGFAFTILLGLGFFVSHAQEAITEHHNVGVNQRDANVPDLPFEDNPDPSLCGIPQPWGDDDPAWLTGYYEGELIQEDVLLYDSHLRRSIVGSAPNGSELEILLYQVNPSLNYYLVRTVGLDDNVQGWVPAPFVAFGKEN
ncbi:MAG: hypothetical protein AAF708_15095 [Deinococcota bacterium]